MTGRLGWVAEALLRIAPAPWRERFRSEVLAQWSVSDRPVRDGVDIALAALGLRADQIGRSQDMTRIAIAVLAIGLLWTAWAVPQLADGVIELPGHWWSAPGPVLALAGGAALALSWGRRRLS